MVGFANVRFVKQGEVRAPGGGWETAAGDGVDGAGTADMGTDRQGKIIPADLAFVAIMIDPGNKVGAADDLQDSRREIGGIGRRPDLIIDDIDGWSFLHQADHGLDEVVAEFGINPGRTDDDRSIGVVLHGFLFALELRSAIDTYRRRGMVFF